MERKGAEVVGLAGAHLDLDQGRFFIFVMQDSVTGAEEGFGIEFLRKLEMLVADYDGVHAVKRERVRLLVFGLVVTGKKIPAALVFLEAERLQQEVARRIHIEALVIDLNHLFIPHCTNDISQEAVAGRLALEYKARTQASTFIDETVEAEGLHHPFTDAAAIQFIFVLNVISIVTSVAFY